MMLLFNWTKISWGHFPEQHRPCLQCWWQLDSNEVENGTPMLAAEEKVCVPDTISGFCKSWERVSVCSARAYTSRVTWLAWKANFWAMLRSTWKRIHKQCGCHCCTGSNAVCVDLKIWSCEQQKSVLSYWMQQNWVWDLFEDCQRLPHWEFFALVSSVAHGVLMRCAWWGGLIVSASNKYIMLVNKPLLKQVLEFQDSRTWNSKPWGEACLIFFALRSLTTLNLCSSRRGCSVSCWSVR